MCNTDKRSKVGDPSFIGLDCETGNVDDCNDGPDQSADCDGLLILSWKNSQCGSKCNITPHSRSSANIYRKWTFWTSQATEIRKYVNSLDHLKY